MRLKLLHKLLLLILPAALCLLIFAAQLITTHIDQSGKASQVYNEIALTTVNSRLVHELQKERGMSAGFLGSPHLARYSGEATASNRTSGVRRTAIMSF